MAISNNHLFATTCANRCVFGVCARMFWKAPLALSRGPLFDSRTVPLLKVCANRVVRGFGRGHKNPLPSSSKSGSSGDRPKEPPANEKTAT